MNHTKLLVTVSFLWASLGYAGESMPALSASARKAKDLIVEGDQNTGNSEASYKKAIGLLSRQGQMKPYEMMLLAQAYAGLGNATRATKPAESVEYFKRANLMLRQIPLQIQRDAKAGISDGEMKMNQFAVEESLKIEQQVKNALLSTGNS